MYCNIENKTLPNSVSIPENKELEAELPDNKFMLKSTVKGMYLSLTEKSKPDKNLGFIHEVNNERGMLFLDKNNISGLHMTGTMPEFRGLGLGKTMTNKLLLEAHKNKSNYVVLVASEAGEKIYSKLGFISDGNLKSYKIR